MPKLDSRNYLSRESDALIIATASDTDVLRLCHELGEDPADVAERVRRLLLGAAPPVPAEVSAPDSMRTTLPFPYPELLPLRRILLVDDDPGRLADRFAEFQRHQFKLGFAIEAVLSGEEALAKLENEKFDAVFIELRSPAHETRWMLERLRSWMTPLPPILLNSVGLDVFDVRILNRNAIRALARFLGKHLPKPYRKKGPARAGLELRKGPASQQALFEIDGKKTGTAPNNDRSSKDSVCALLVGDYDDSRLLIHKTFRDCGWRLIEARVPKSALEHLDKERIHVVITNSESTGPTWRQLLRILSQRVRPPQLIVTSRTADDHLWSEVLNCGGYDVLPEPFRPDEIERVVASARRHYDPKPLRVIPALQNTNIKSA